MDSFASRVKQRSAVANLAEFSSRDTPEGYASRLGKMLC